MHFAIVNFVCLLCITLLFGIFRLIADNFLKYVAIIFPSRLKSSVFKSFGIGCLSYAKHGIGRDILKALKRFCIKRA